METLIPIALTPDLLAQQANSQVSIVSSER
jgi:hypothetical protein